MHMRAHAHVFFMCLCIFCMYGVWGISLVLCGAQTTTTTTTNTPPPPPKSWSSCRELLSRMHLRCSNANAAKGRRPEAAM